MAIAVKQKPKITPHHKRRHGMHQKRSHQFTKTYWPYLPLLLVVATGLLVNSFLVRPNVLGYATNMTSYGLLANTNAAREANNSHDLALSNSLSQAAQAKANDMATRNYWSHKTPEKQEPWTFIDKSGYVYEAAAENLAYGFETSDQAVKGWMNSPEHRVNLLNDAYTQVGFGVANSSNYQTKGEETIVVAFYAKPALISAPNSSRNTTLSTPLLSEAKIDRVQLATSGLAPWSTFVVLAGIVLFTVIVLTRHSKAWHKKIRKSEQFILRHKLLDIVLVGVIMLGFILTRTAGFIQ
jgi:hypothetical protein